VKPRCAAFRRTGLPVQSDTPSGSTGGGSQSAAAFVYVEVRHLYLVWPIQSFALFLSFHREIDTFSLENCGGCNFPVSD